MFEKEFEYDHVPSLRSLAMETLLDSLVEWSDRELNEILGTFYHP